MAEVVCTYSVAACDLEARQWGVAVQSRALACGAVVPWVEPEVGAIATQAHANPGYGPDGLALLREGAAAAEVVERLTAADGEQAHRQLAVVDGRGRPAVFTGDECLPWAGGRTGDGYSVQGNILVSAAVVDAMAESFESSAGAPLPVRLLGCLDTAQAAGGDRRGQQAAGLLVAGPGGRAGLSAERIDLRVDDHERPLDELRRLYGLFLERWGR